MFGFFKNSALIKAARDGQIETVKRLLDKGADVNAKDKYRNTALIFALNNDRTEIVKLLLDKGADMNVTISPFDDTPLTETIEMAIIRRGNTEIVKLLLDKGADVNATTSWGLTPLMGTIRRNITTKEDIKIEIVKLLLDKGADVNAKTSSGDTALMLAAKGGNTEIVKLLLDKGADVNAKTSSGDTALMLAAKGGNTEIVKLLLDKGADVNAKTSSGDTALMLAAKGGNTEIVKLLLDKGADVNAKHYYGRTVPLYAKSKQIAELLLKHGAKVTARSSKKESSYSSRDRWIVWIGDTCTRGGGHVWIGDTCEKCSEKRYILKDPFKCQFCSGEIKFVTYRVGYSKTSCPLCGGYPEISVDSYSNHIWLEIFYELPYYSQVQNFICVNCGSSKTTDGGDVVSPSSPKCDFYTKNIS